VYRISARGIRIFAHHGVLPEERRAGQEFLVDFDIDVDADQAASGDELERTVDYSVVVERIDLIATERRFDLVEALAVEILDYLLSLEPVRRATVTVKKPSAPLKLPFDWVGVTCYGETGEAGEEGWLRPECR
jgi:dihydroneopterin aldolase